MKNIDKNIVYLGWVSFFTDMASSMVTVLLPIYVVYVLKESVDKLGIIIAVATFVSYFLRIIFGYLSDKFGIVKPFVVTGYLISAVTKPLIAFTHSYISVAALRGAERVGKAIRSASKDSLISSYVKNKQDGKTFGFHKMMDISGEMSGSLILFLLFHFISKNEMMIRDIFKATFIPGMIAVFIVIFFVKDAPKKVKSKDNIFNNSDLKLLPVLISYFGFLFFIMSDQFLILKAKESGYGLSVIPLMMITFTAIQAVSSYYMGIFIDKIGSSKSLLIAYLFGIISIILLRFNIWFSFAFLGLFTVLSLNSLRAYISKKANSKGFVYGIFYAGVSISSALGALAIGFIWKIYGFSGATFFSIAGMSLTIVIYYIERAISRYKNQ